MTSDTEQPSNEVEEMEDDDSGAPFRINQELLSRPDVLAALQSRTTSLDAMLQALPKKVKRRIKGLKKIQLEAMNIEAKFYQEIHELECRYHKLYVPLYEKRCRIIGGHYEPDDTECDFPSDDEKEDELSSELKTKVKIEETPTDKDQEDVSGVPDFWLTIFKNVGMLSDMVETYDEPILRHLEDIKVKLEEDPMGFILEFHFSPNEYFSNTVLTKEYKMKCLPDASEPFSFEGPEIYKCKGCTIDWKKGKNVTIKTVKKKQKHKSRGSLRTILKTIQNDSFFNFFTPPVLPDDPGAEADEETQSLLTSDFEIGHYIRERIVPRAVLYYTGEALEDEDEYEEEAEEECEEEEDEEDDDEDVEGGKTGGGDKKATSKGGSNRGPPAECKQQ